MTSDGFAATWAYFFLYSESFAHPLSRLTPGSKCDAFRVDDIRTIRGECETGLEPRSTLVRLETASRLTFMDGLLPTPLFQGVTQHLQYTSRRQRDELNRRSRCELAPSPDTVSVLIPIRKSAQWWSLAHDERQSHFREFEGKLGHTAIGAAHVDRIHRKLYHSRYAFDASYDFLTYFEFERSQTLDYQDLLAALRNPHQNPEWSYVESEQEIWMTKVSQCSLSRPCATIEVPHF